MQRLYFDRNDGYWHLLKDSEKNLVNISLRYVDFKNVKKVRVVNDVGNAFIYFDDDVDCKVTGDVGHKIAVCRGKD